MSGWNAFDFPGLLFFALGGLGPALAAILLTYRKGPEAWRDYWRRVFDFRRIRPGWYAVIFLVPVVVNILAILTGLSLGAEPPSFADAMARLANPLTILPLAVFLLFLGPIPEELGWRGYALDPLQTRWSAFSASMIIGGFSLLWHVPMFFMAGSYIQRVFPIGSTVFWAGFVAPFLVYMLIYTWMYNHTGRSTLSAILLHFMTNFTGEFLTIRDEYILYRAMWLVVLAIALVAIWGPETLTRREQGSARSESVVR